MDAACAMLAASSTMFDVLSWGGETQALIYHPDERRVIGINALGVAPTGATPEFFRERGLAVPPEYGLLSTAYHRAQSGRLLLNDAIPAWVREDLEARGYDVETRPRTSGPINVIYFDQAQGTFQGGASDYGEDYGIGW